ncbi:MAG: GyrI-like domain-containing protein [Bacteriovoracaceae bacterium]|jgi:predicted transcriptional regulator YdeE|nr:GyrI-like domain-containing protein [Bacteriovoracaceae bacterium]
MKSTYIQKKQTAYGITVRTKNANEINPKTAQIGKLWESFYKDIFVNLSAGTSIIGVYSNYESDQNGAFDVSACSDQKINGLNKITLKSGNYLVFTGKGEMPNAVINTWKEIWDYFSNDNCIEKRIFQTDYELYKGPSEVEIYIGIK